MAENEGAGGREDRCDTVLATMLQVYFEALRREPLPGRLVATVRELAASYPRPATGAGQVETPRRLQ